MKFTILNIPMLERPVVIARRKPKLFSLRAKKEGWSNQEMAHHLPCPDCTGWISLNDDHDHDCCRIQYRKGRT